MLDSVHSRNPELRLEWIASDGTVIYDTSGEMQHYEFKQLTDRFVNMPNNLWGEDETITLAYSLNNNATALLFVLKPAKRSDESEGSSSSMHATFKVLYTLQFCHFYYLPWFRIFCPYGFSPRSIDASASLNKALNQVNFRSDVIVLKDKSKDEIGQLTRHYNGMASEFKAKPVKSSNSKTGASCCCPIFPMICEHR